MKKIKFLGLFLILVGVIFSASTKTMTSDQAKEEMAYSIGLQAAIWGRPLAEYVDTNYAALKADATNISYWHKFSDLKTAADRFIVTPNNVSIDAYGIADLSKEPAVISVPILKEKRWYIVQIGNMYDEIITNIGGSKGPQPGLYILTGPDYKGPIPKNMKEIKVNTEVAATGVRIFVNGEKDLAAAREVQKNFHFLPLSVYQKSGLNYTVPKPEYSRYEFSGKAPENLRIFDKIGFGMTIFLPLSEDSEPLVKSFHQIGLSVKDGFNWQNLDEPTKRGLVRAAVAAEQIIENAYQNTAEKVNGWRYTMSGGKAGDNWPLRAALVKYALGSNLAEEIMYPNTTVDGDGNALSGANNYVLRFEKNQIPPVNVLWNLSMYDEKALFIENDFKRYTIGSTTDGLKTDADGSITIYIQNKNPGKDKESNWLPAPTGKFNLTMRFYGAQKPILDGTYRLPGVQKVK